MNVAIVLTLFVLGLIILIKGGDWFVDAAVWIASITGMPSILIGATVVSFATTLPEVFVSAIATIEGSQEVAIGNAIGSLNTNIGLIVAISSILMPSKIEKESFVPKALLMFFSTILAFIFSLNRVITIFEGFILLSVLGIYLYLTIRQVKMIRARKRNPSGHPVKQPFSSRAIMINTLKFIGGIIFIILGARLLVNNGIKIADYYDIPEQIVGATFIAIGTSLPELTTAVTSIIKGHHGISIGNILGANILNIAMVLGFSSVISMQGLVISSRKINLFGRIYEQIPQTLYIDLPISFLLILVLIVPTMLKGKLKRSYGFIMLAVYATYNIFLVSSVF